MFEGAMREVETLGCADEIDTRACADALAGSVLAQRRLDARRVTMLAHWADLHPVLDESEADPGWTRLRRRTQTKAESYGADGTPPVSEFAATELGLLLQTTTTTAGHLLRDVLDLRHRHPRLHRAVLEGEVELWQARQAVRACARADLSLEQAHQVDEQTIAALTGLPFGRAMTVVEGKIIAADPEAYERRRAEEAQRRYVSVGRRPNEYGLRTLVAQSTAGDIARLIAMIFHLADLILAAGDTDPAPVRRAKALALLANPALACVFLAEAHQARDQRLAAMRAADVCDGTPGEVPGPGELTDVSQTADLSEPPESTDVTEVGASQESLDRHVTAVDLAVGFGNQLRALGSSALDRLRPKTVLYLHLSEEALASGTQPEGEAGETAPGARVVRAEGLGALSMEQVTEWLHSAVGVDQVVVRPVIDPSVVSPVDCYEVPAHMRESLELAQPFEVFPYGTLRSRSADADHTIPYVALDKGGPPGQTRLDNLGPLGRTHHRAKTFGGFTVHQPLPGMYLWRTPTGHWFQVDSMGTHQLGRRHPEILGRRRRPVRTTGYTEAVADIHVVCDWAA